MKRDNKLKIIKKHALHEKDTGSAQVQVAILTQRINQLTEHLKGHKKDNHSRRGLLGLVGQRRKHLQYLKVHRGADYEKLIAELDLRK